MQYDERYKFISTAFSSEEIESTFSEWYKTVQVTANWLGGGDYFEISADRVEMAVLDYFTDLTRLGDFHKIRRPNDAKKIAYGLYWLSRRGPLQVVDPNVPQHLVYINEKVTVFVFLPMMLRRVLGSRAESVKDYGSKMLEYAHLLYYNICYRDYTQKSLELMVDAFFAGAEVSLA